MKIAVIADIHANFIALNAIVNHIDMWAPDIVVVAGDIINRGPRPSECLSLILERARNHGWLILKGNHEDYVISQADPDMPRLGPVFEVHRASFWTFQKLRSDIPKIAGLPFTQSLRDPSDKVIRFAHASMRGNRDGIYPDTPDRILLEQIGVPPALFGVGHTHIPLIRQLDKTLIVNVGSAGLPFDKNINPSYARLVWSQEAWIAKIIRVKYDIQTAIRDFHTSGYIDEAGPLSWVVIKELEQARSLLYHWARKYQKHALMGEITMQQSVDEFLAVM
jgi:predicted phosphodiesterase